MGARTVTQVTRRHAGWRRYMHTLQYSHAVNRRLAIVALRYSRRLSACVASPKVGAARVRMSGRIAMPWDHVIARVAPVIAVAVAILATVITFAGYMP
jgi:hypothetical protein